MFQARYSVMTASLKKDFIQNCDHERDSNRIREREYASIARLERIGIAVLFIDGVEGALARVVGREPGQIGTRLVADGTAN